MPANLDRPVNAHGFDGQASAILAHARTSYRNLDRHETVIAAGDPGASLVLIQRGWAGHMCRDADGRRQIIDLLLPGDLCGLESFVSLNSSHTIETLSEATIVRFDANCLRSLAAEHPILASALLKCSIHQNVRSHANQARMFKRGGIERLADLIYSLSSRLNEFASNTSKPDIPLTQADLADASGLTAIHVNRALRALRIKGVIAVDRRSLRVMDMASLGALAGHFDGEPRSKWLYAVSG